MAHHISLRLPGMKLRKRSTRGSSQREVIHPNYGLSQPQNVEESEKSESDEALPGCGIDPEMDPGYDTTSFGDIEGPSLYKIQQDTAASGWEKIRSSLLRAAVEASAMPPEQCCVNEPCIARATLRCQKCGLSSFYCPDCFIDIHAHSNFFHVAEEWKDDGYFRPRPLEGRCIQPRPHHECSTWKSVPLCCIDEDGLEHHIVLQCCDCEPVTTTMVHMGIWPASPHCPQLAFTFSLMDWVEALMMECQVALKDFCAALYFKCPYVVKKRRDIYRSLIDAFEEYRYMKHEIRNLNFICEGLDNGNICPACPKNSGSLFISMDALFGLPRKKSAGNSVRPPLTGNLFFEDQTAVDEYVLMHSKEKLAATKSSLDCSDFLAGNAIRSSSRYYALDETAVFGSVCRHDFPKRFFNLKHGERLSYALWMLQQFENEISGKSMKLYLMYDIACVLAAHLQKKDPHLLAQICLVVPSFHAYGHIASYQVRYSPLRSTGVGLTDGEGTERLWSFLRRFSKMTKEMRPSHRTDVLSHALAHYGWKKKNKIGNFLCMRLQRAYKSLAVATESFEQLISTLPFPVTDSDIKQWIDDDKFMWTSNSSDSRSWKVEYFQKLQKYYRLRDHKADKDDMQISSLLDKLGRQLEKIEKDNCFQRWTPMDNEFQQLRQEQVVNQRQSLLSAIHDSAVRRKFLLQIKGKYADGQRIAKRVSSQINKETRKLKKLVIEYNKDSVLPEMTMQTALNPDETNAETDVHMCATHIQMDTKDRNDIIHAYLKKIRSSEEIAILKDEVKSSLDYFQEKQRCIKGCCTNLHANNDVYSRGAHNLLTHLLWKVELCTFPVEACKDTIDYNTEFESEFDISSSSSSDSETDE